MDYFYRLGAAAFLAAALVLGFAPKAHAAFPATQTNTGACTVAPCYEYQISGQAAWYPSRVEACVARVAEPFPNSTDQATYFKVYVRDDATFGCTYDIRRRSDSSLFAAIQEGYQVRSATPAAPTYSCPSGATLSGSSCSCNSGFTQQGNSCVSEQSIKDAECKTVKDSLNLIGAPLIHYGPVGVTACYGGYQISGSGGASGSLDGVASQSELYGPFSCGTSATSCSAVPMPTGQTACPPGEFPGTVNGIAVCAPSSDTNTIQAPEKTTSEPPAGSPPGTPGPPIEGAPEGTATAEKQTTCVGDKCTTTTVYKDPNGTTIGSKSEEKSKGQACVENPKAPGCAPAESKFSGTCEGGFTGTGDALQKATAEAVNKTKCLLDPGTAIESVAAQLEAGTFGPELENTTRNISNFTQTNPLGNSCPADTSITVAGATVSIPLSQACDLLQALGAIAVLFTLIYSTIFVVKGF